jgi:hypothetical protein
MVDFEGGKRGGFERDNGVEESLDLGSTNYQDAPASASAGTRILVPDASGTVTLPAGVSLDDITVQGRDLVVTLADGSTIVIPDGAIVFPQLVIDGASVEPLTLAALLNDALTPEAEPGQLPSSGGEFEDGEGFLQDAFDLGDLLPYTELPLGVEEEEEVIPFSNSEPDIVIETPDNPVGVENAIATVAERGLPERGEPAEPEGTADETNAETTSGTIVFDAPDGLSAVQINGVAITTVGQEFVSPFGTLTITSIDLANGEIGFSYTLADNLLGETVDGFFEATVFDLDGDSATASLSIIVEDDSPIAAADIGIVPAGSHDPISGNVLDNDESGADDYPEGEEGPAAVTGFTSVETGATGEPGDEIPGEYGKLTLNADGSYTYVRDFNTPGGVTEDFTYTIIDQDGSTAQTTLTINIDDAGNEIEIPEIGDGTIVEESGLPERGDPAEPEGTDEPSDGETTSGTITFNSPDGVGSITINGVELDLGNEAGNDADDQTVIDDETGTLVITSVTYDPATGDGTITYEYTLGDNTLGDQDVDGGNTTVPFDVVITDLDDDVAEDTLVITIVDDAPFIEANEEEPSLVVDETDLATDDTVSFAGAFDITPGADGLSSVDYELGITAAASGLIDTLSGEAVELSMNGGVVEGRTETGGDLVFTVSVDGDGNVTLDQSRAVVHADTTDHDDPVSLTDELVTLTATATDGDGDSADATINIGENLTFRDDGPAIDASVVDGDTVRLNTQDAETRGADTDTATSTANFSGAFSIASSDAGADGEASVVWDYSLEVVDGDSGLSSDGDPITLSLVGGVVEGRTSGGVLVFDIAVDAATGVVTLNQYEELDHSLPGDDSDYDLQELALDTGLVNLVGEATITDGDGDTASDTETLDLGGNIVFDDDGPSVTADGPEAELEVDETDFDTNDTKDFSGAFSVDFGADGAGTVEYTLGVTSAASGLIDTVSGEAVILSMNAGVVEGRTETGDELVFTVSVDGDGNVTLDQSRAVVHADDTDHDDPVSLADELVTLTATATDGDGDTAEDTINIGDNLTFRDDGPSIGLNEQFVAPSLEVDETNLDVDDDGNAFAGAFTSDFGADEAGSIDYSLVITIGGDSGLVDVATGESILLYYDGDDVVGRVIGGVDDGEEAFRVSVDEFGNVSLDQSRALVHGNTADHDDPVSPDAGSIQLLAVITDGDGDQDDAILDLSDGIVFRDDGPSVTQNGDPIGTVVLDESPADEDEGGDFAPAGLASATLDLGDNFDLDFGADGEAASNSTTYALVLDGAPVASGLFALDAGQPLGQGDEIMLEMDDNDVVGMAGGTEYFRISVDADGVVTFTQSNNIWHGNTGSDDDTASLIAAAGAFVLEATVTDGDGDTDTAEIDLGGSVFQIEDDGPSTSANAFVQLDDDDLSGGNDGGIGDVDSSVVLTGTLGHDFGTDGAGSITFASMDGTSVNVGGVLVTYSWSGDTLTANDGTNDIFTVQVNPTTGAYEVTQLNPLDHHLLGDNVESNPEFALTYTVTDADGDSETGTFTVKVNDDTPEAEADSFTQETEDAPVTGFVGTNDSAGADGLGSYVYNGDIVNGMNAAAGSLNFNTATGEFTYTPGAGETGTLTFTYTLVDGDGDEVTEMVTINLLGDSTPTLSDDDLTVWEEGLPARTGESEGSNEPANNETASGDFTITTGNDTLAVLEIQDADGFWIDVTAATVATPITVTGANGTLTVTSSGGVYSYSYTLEDNLENHPDNDPNEPVDPDGIDGLADPLLGEAFAVRVEDSDGDEAFETLTVTVLDDAPTANDDGVPTPIAVAEDTTTTIDVLSNDVQGADSVDPATGVALETQATNGTAVYVGNGEFEYTPNAGYEGADSFTYTITDGDGDQSTATVYVNVAPDSVPEFDAGNATVDEDGLLGSNADNSQVDPTETTSTGLASDTVNFTVDYFNDTPADVDAAIAFINADALDDQLTSHGELVNFELVGGVLTGTINGGATTVMTITLNAGNDNGDGTVDYSYTVNLLEPVKHNDTNSEDSVVLSGVTIQVIDSDLTPQTDTFDVTVVDDVPTANNETIVQFVENGAFGGDVSLNDVEGIDTPATYALVGNHDGDGQLVFNSNGTFLYTPASGEEDDVTFTYSLTDADGDVDTAVVTLDLRPDSTPTANPVIAKVDDEGLNLGENAANDDIDANVGDLNAGQPGDTEAIWKGMLDGDAGLDGPEVYSFIGMNGQPGTAGLESVIYNWDAITNTLTAEITASPEASRVGTDLFSVQITDVNSGAYTVTLLQNFLHTGGDNGEEAGNLNTVALNYSVSDSDTSPDSATSTLTITFGDDAPLPFTPDSGFVNDVTDPLVPQPVTDSLNLAIGADTPAQLSFAASLDGQPVIDLNTGEPVTVGNDPLTYQIQPNGDLVGITAGGVIGFTFELDASAGEYTFTVEQNLSNGTSTEFNNLTSTAAGNVNFRGIGADDPVTSVDALLSGISNGVQSTVNTDSDSIGVANQSMDASDGEFLRIDFVSNLTSGGAGPTGFNFDGIRPVTQSFQQDVPQVQGNQDQTASIRVFAVDSSAGANVTPDTNPLAGGLANGDTIEQITTVTVTDWQTGDTSAEFNVLSLAVGATGSVGFGVTVTRNSDGSVTFAGLQEGDSYEIETATDFTAVIVQAVSGSFDLGIFSIGSFNAGDDIELSVGVVATDEDGDTATGTIDVTIDQDGSGPPVVPVVLDLQGDGADAFVGLDAGVAYDYDGDGVKTKTAWIAAGAAILAYDANSNGMVDGAGEFVFGDADTTDLEAILAKFDTNDNAVLDAGDAEYGKFGVWMDDGDGVYEDGEFKSLEDAGIASIDLELNGIGGDAADGDVEIFNTVNFTYTDGNTGTAYDAAFELGGDVLDTSAASMDALLAMADETSPSDDTGTKTVEGSQSETPEATEIVKDVLAENVVDAMLDAISGDHGIQPTHAAITMASDVLMKSIDTGAFAFDSGAAADMTDEAAAMAAMNA